MQSSILHLQDGELSIRLDNMTIRGKSKGGCCTSIMIDDLNVAFDMGYCPSKVEKLTDIFISHGHTDHIGCLHYCYATKKLTHMKHKWNVTMPSCYIPCYKILATTISSLGRGGFPLEFIDGTALIRPFDKFLCDIYDAESCIKKDLIGNHNYCATGFEMKHKIRSFGYIIYEKRSKLKKELAQLKGHELKELKTKNIQITEQIDIPTIAFSGDTIIDTLLTNDDMLNSQILIMECTHFLDSSIDESIANGHIHFQQFMTNIDKFKNKWIILCHFSQKYRTYDDIKKYHDMLSDEDKKRVIFFI